MGGVNILQTQHHGYTRRVRITAQNLSETHNYIVDVPKSNAQPGKVTEAFKSVAELFSRTDYSAIIAIRYDRAHTFTPHMTIGDTRLDSQLRGQTIRLIYVFQPQASHYQAGYDKKANSMWCKDCSVAFYRDVKAMKPVATFDRCSLQIYPNGIVKVSAEPDDAHPAIL